MNYLEPAAEIYDMNLPRFYLKHLTQIIVLFGLLILATNVWSFNTFGQNNFGSKWDAPQFGTGAVVTWSFMTPGVALSNNPALSAWSGINSLGSGNSDDIRKKIDTVFGVGAFDAAVRRAFATWAAAANLQFVEVADSGAPLAGSTTHSRMPWRVTWF